MMVILPKDDREMPANDILYGARAIAEFLFGDPRQRSRVYHLCAKGHLPHFRPGTSRKGRIYARKSTLREWGKERNRVTASEAQKSEVREDDATAVQRWRSLAEQGDAEAQCNLGRVYADGKGATRDDREASKWFRRAAEKGHADAQFILGVAYAEGLFGTQDDREAVKWCRQAAEQGHPDAQHFLGLSYADGRGVTQDFREALRWCRLAAEKADAQTERMLGSLCKQIENHLNHLRRFN